MARISKKTPNKWIIAYFRKITKLVSDIPEENIGKHYEGNSIISAIFWSQLWETPDLILGISGLLTYFFCPGNTNRACKIFQENFCVRGICDSFLKTKSIYLLELMEFLSYGALCASVESSCMPSLAFYWKPKETIYLSSPELDLTACFHSLDLCSFWVHSLWQRLKQGNLSLLFQVIFL